MNFAFSTPIKKKQNRWKSNILFNSLGFFELKNDNKVEHTQAEKSLSLIGVVRWAFARGSPIRAALPTTHNQQRPKIAP